MRKWRFITLLFTALSMGMAFCHTLEMPVKMGYDGSLWTTVNQSLYRLFGTVGAFVEVGAIILAAVLSFLVRKRRPAFQLTLTGTVFLALALLVWFVFTAPMNAEISRWTVGSLPTDWTRVRNQWEYSHATRFVLQLIGFSALLLSVLLETPNNHLRDRSGFRQAELEATRH